LPLDLKNRELLTLRETREALAIAPSKLYELLEDGELDSFPIGRNRRVTVASFLAFIERKKASSRDANGRLIKDTKLDGFRGAEGKAKKAARRAGVR
jgi:hypothetical protein